MRPILRSFLVAAVVLSTAAFVTLASVPTSAPGATLASKQAQARRLDAEVSKLETKYDELQERYRGAMYELEQIQKDVDEAHRVVVATRKDLQVAKRRLALRAETIYRTGGTGSSIADLASAGSFTDFFDRLETVRRVGDQDANVLDRIEVLNARVEKKERVLRTAKARQAAATRRAKRDKEKMQSLLDQRQAKLDSVNADIRRIMEAQRRAAEARARAAARRSASKARSAAAAAPSSDSSSSSSSSSGVSIPLPPGSSTAAAAANAAMGKLGSPYVWAAAGPNSFDCSGLVVWAFAQVGRSGLPHSTYSLINMGVEVPLDQLQVGDLVFSSSIGHVGIYVGGGSFVHAPHTGDVVKVTSLGEYSMSRARRI
ncbi:MAG: C40 family peptidase [Thermoleophilia bacterium]|nr:C40 family peptidase [Thermoleophilia bacterium]